MPNGGTTAEYWPLPPTPTSQIPTARPSGTPRGTASDSLLDSLSKVSTMSPNTRPPSLRSEHPQGGGEQVSVKRRQSNKSHRRDGNTAIFSFGSLWKQKAVLKAGSFFPPPPCGEGSGVGVSKH